jgi:hypothetical protein
VALTSLVVRIGADDQSVQKALDSLGKQAKTVDGELARLGNTPVGREVLKSLDQIGASMKTVTDAHQKLADRAVNAARGMELMGGASKFTGDELAQLNRIAVKGVDAFRALGQEAPPALQQMAEQTKKATSAGQGFTSFLGQANGLLGAFGIGLSIGAVVSFGRGILAAADNLTKLRDTTGFSIENLQRFQVAGDDAGNTIDEIATASTKLSDNLVGGNKSTAAAIERLGLSLDEIRMMSPDQQFIAISDAIRKIEDPAQQVNIAIDLFGKAGATILPVLKRGFDDVRDAAVGMSRDTVEAIADVGDALQKASRSFTGQAANFISFAFLGWGKAARDATRQIEELDKTVKAALSRGGPGFGAIVPPGLPKDLDQIEAALARTHRTITTAGQAAHLAAEHHRQFAESVHSLTSSAIGAAKGFGAFGQLMPDLSARAAESMEQMRLLSSSVLAVGAGFGTLPNVVPRATKAIEDATTATKQLTAKTSSIHDLATSFTQLAQISGDSFGGIVKELATMTAAMAMAEKAGKDLAAGGGLLHFSVAAVGAMDAATKSTKRWSATLGGAMTGMAIGNQTTIPFAGAIGFLAGALVGLARSAGAAERAINPLRQQFVDAAGGLAALNAKAVAAGTSLTAMLNARNAKEYAKAIDELNKAFELANMKKMIDDFVELNGGFVTLDIKAHTAGVTLEKVLNAKTPEAYKKAIDDLNDAFKFQDDAMKILDQTVEKYGFTIDQLGPTFAQQKLNEQAGTLLQDYKVLTAAGVDHNAILAKMGPSMSKYVSDAQKAGASIPLAMKPTLDAMITAGTLTDASGKKMKDLSGLTFSETLTDKFQKIIDRIDKLVLAIERGLAPAIQNIPVPKPIDVPVTFTGRWNIPEMPRWGEAKGFALGGRVQALASGGRVLPFLSRGSDTVPAMLTPGERVLTVQETQAYEATGTGGGHNAAIVSVLNQLRADAARREATAEQRLARVVRDEVQKVVGR